MIVAKLTIQILGKEKKMSDLVMEVNDSNFDAEVLNSTIPVFVDFWAPWCGPCLMVAPVVKELAQEMQGRVKFVKVNVDDSPLTASKFGIMSIPTLLIFKGGMIVGNQVGAVPKPMLKNIIERSL